MGRAYEENHPEILANLTDEKLNYYSDVLKTLIKEKVINNDATMSYQAHEKFIKWISQGIKRKEEAKITLKKIDEYLPFMTNNPILRMKLYRTLEKVSATEINDYLVPVITPVLKSELSSDYCKEDSIQKLIFPQVFQIAENFEESKKEFDVEVSKIMNLSCWKAFQAGVRENLHGPNYKKYFPIMKFDRNFPESDKQFARMRYLLDGPEKSEQLNQSFNALLELAKDDEKRTAIVKKFKKFTHLPDETLSMKTKQLNSLSLSLIRYFPEYFDHYTAVCVQYLEGKSFPKGNPTKHCKQFYLKLREQKDRSILPRNFAQLQRVFNTTLSL